MSRALAGISACLLCVAVLTGGAVAQEEHQRRSLFSVTDDGGIAVAGTVEAPGLKTSGEVAAQTGAFGASLSFGSDPPVDVATAFAEAQKHRSELDASVAQLQAVDEALGATDAETTALNEEQNNRLQKLETDFAAAAAAEAEQAAAILETNTDVSQKFEAQGTAFEQHVQEATAGMAKAAEDLASLEQRLLEKIDSQQKTIDMLVGIVSKFDVTADLERLRSQNANPQ